MTERALKFRGATSGLFVSIALLVGMILAQPARSQEPNSYQWQRYCDHTNGECIDIPDSYSSYTGEHGEVGIQIQRSDGFVARIYSRTKTDSDNQDGNILNWLSSGSYNTPEYTRKKGNWYVISGSKGIDAKYYIREYITSDHVTTLQIEIPSSDNIKYADVIKRMSLSMNPTEGFVAASTPTQGQNVAASPTTNDTAPATSASSSVPNSSKGGGVGAAAAVALFAIMGIGMVLVLYCAPTIVAILRKHPQALAIGAVNVLFGWTFIGWCIALIWALTSTQHAQQTIIVQQGVGAPSTASVTENTPGAG